MMRSSLPSRAASVGPVGHRPERKARGWRGGSALTTQGLGSPSTAGPGAPAAPWGRSGQCLLGLSPCCQEHILAISDRARDLGRISLSFPRAFNKLPPFPPLHLPELRIIHTHTHPHTPHIPTHPHTHTHTLIPGVPVWQSERERNLGQSPRESSVASPHLPQQMLSAANSDCGLKAEACLSPAPEALWAFPGPPCQVTSCSSLRVSLARPRDSQFIFASLC